MLKCWHLFKLNFYAHSIFNYLNVVLDDIFSTFVLLQNNVYETKKKKTNCKNNNSFHAKIFYLHCYDAIIINYYLAISNKTINKWLLFSYFI